MQSFVVKKYNTSMKIECKIDSNNKNLVQVCVIYNNNLISQIDCQQVNLCEKLPSLIYTLEENIKADGKNLQNIKQIDISIDSTKNINGRNNSLKRFAKNIVIYGHHVEGSGDRMFKALLKYKDASYYKSHPVIALDSMYNAIDYYKALKAQQQVLSQQKQAAKKHLDSLAK